MRKVREVLRLRWEQGLSHRQIAASCKMGLGTVGEYLRRASAVGVAWPLPEDWSDEELERRLFPPADPTGATNERVLPDWEYVHRELRRKGVTLLLLWQEYAAPHPTALRYSRFCECYQEWRRASEPRMRQVHKAGEKLFVDYAGLTVPMTDPTTGERWEAQVFVAALGASSYLYAEATESQALPDWIGSHVRTFAHLGGVPTLVVPDNLKSGVSAACYYEPELNPTYQELARHYGTAILPARVRKPRDKAKVESGVLQVERWVLAPLRNRTFFSLSELNTAMAELLQALNDRPGQGLPASRRELFESLDRPALQPLPEQLYDWALWKKARVHLDYHLQVDDHFYSVPHRLVRQQVETRLTVALVEVFHRGERVASHLRSHQKYGFTTLPEHMPEGHRAFAERDAQRLLRRAGEYGAATEAYFRKVMASRRHPELGYRSCLGILRLGKVHGAERLEQACRQLLEGGGYSYQSVRRLLTRTPEPPSAPPESAPSVPLQHANVRGADYYRPQEQPPQC